MDLRKLQHAVLLAQTCHFARAAALAHITQSALSRSISALEDELGMRLFERGNTGVAPTAAGRTLIQRAQPLLRGARDLSHDMALFRRAELGTRRSVAVSWIGKVNTTAQMTALVWMLWRPYPWVEWAGIALFLVAAVLTLWSMLQYLNAARGDLLDQ